LVAAYVLSFSAALSEEVRGTGVHVMALCPGPVPTGFQAAACMDIAPSQKHAVLSAEETVRRGLSAYERGKAVYVPGGLNRAGAVGAKLLPRPWIVRVVGNMMRQKRPIA
jgi:short-subunit dehydrogenase